MNTFLSKNKADIIICVIAFFVIFVLNFMTGYTSDDYAYSFVFKQMPVEPIEKIDGISSIIRSQIHHYNIWNGRFLAHSIVQFFMQYNKVIFNILNSAAFILLGFIIKSIASKPDNKYSKSTYCVIFGLMWLLLPDFGKTVLWVSGSGNYLWMSLFYSSFILFISRKSNSSLANIATSIIIGFLAGATNENSGPAAILIAILIVSSDIKFGYGLKIWKIAGIASSCIGSYLIITAPGSKRMGGVNLSLDTIIQHFITVSSADILLFSSAYIVLISFIVLACSMNRIKENDIVFISIFIIGHFSALYSMIFSPYFVTRAAFGSAVFLIVPMVYIFNLVKENKVCNITFTTSIVFVSFVLLCNATYDIRRSYFEMRENIKLLSNSDKGSDVTLKILTKSESSYNAYNGTSNITPYKQAWFNQWMAKYYGVKSITGKNR